MIIGGAYQGKLAYAKETFPDVRWTDGEQCEKEAIFQYRGIFHFHKYIERLLSEGEDISLTDVDEELYAFDFSTRYNIKLEHNNSLGANLQHHHKVTSSSYTGDYDFWQHLWFCLKYK